MTKPPPIYELHIPLAMGRTMTASWFGPALRITAESVQRAADGTEFVMLKVEGVDGPVRVERVKEEGHEGH